MKMKWDNFRFSKFENKEIDRSKFERERITFEIAFFFASSPLSIVRDSGKSLLFLS